MPGAEDRPYACPGGFYIGDDVLVAMGNGEEREARVRGKQEPFVEIQYKDDGQRFLASPEQLTRVG